MFEGDRSGGQAHQKELLAKLDTLRASRPYLPWLLVDQLEKTGKAESCFSGMLDGRPG